MTKETILKKQVKDWLKYKRLDFFYNLQGLGAYKGIPDIFVFYKGEVVGVEFKTPTGQLSEGQKEFKEMMERNGCEYMVVRDLDDMIRRFN